jgi:O-methyltransferase
MSMANTAPIKQRFLRSFLIAYLQRFGYALIRQPGTTEYDNNFPLAKYSPWNLDQAFLATYAQIRKHTLVDLYRCWELWTLVQQTRKLSGAIIEVGVWRGGTGALIAKQALLSGIPDTVYLCDTFEGVVKARGAHDKVYRGGEHADTTREIVDNLLQKVGLTNTQILTGIFPEHTALSIPAETRIRLCHIDVDVYKSANDVLEWVWDRLVPGGLVVYDDYGDIGCTGIRQHVNEQLGVSDRLVFHNLNGHAIIVKVPAARPHTTA